MNPESKLFITLLFVHESACSVTVTMVTEDCVLCYSLNAAPWIQLDESRE